MVLTLLRIRPGCEQESMRESTGRVTKESEANCRRPFRASGFCGDIYPGLAKSASPGLHAFAPSGQKSEDGPLLPPLLPRSLCLRPPELQHKELAIATRARDPRLRPADPRLCPLVSWCCPLVPRLCPPDLCLRPPDLCLRPPDLCLCPREIATRPPGAATRPRLIATRPPGTATRPREFATRPPEGGPRPREGRLRPPGPRVAPREGAVA